MVDGRFVDEMSIDDLAMNLTDDDFGCADGTSEHRRKGLAQLILRANPVGVRTIVRKLSSKRCMLKPIVSACADAAVDATSAAVSRCFFIRAFSKLKLLP
jgi:hypothetical protein